MAKVALVTGASTGIGRQIAGLLANSGCRVFGTSRSPQGERLDNFEMLPLDVTSDDSVRACLAALLERAGRLDVLVNNAGVELLGGAEEIGVDEAKWIFETNFFGVMRVTGAALPAMRAQQSGCIINISSLAGVGGAPFQGLYVASKHALEGYTESLRYEVKPFGVRVALVEPGFFRSEIGSRKRLPANPIPAYDRARERVLQRWQALYEAGPDPAPVAQTILAIADGRSTRFRHFIGPETFMAEWKYIVPDWLVEQRMRWMFGLDDLLMDTLRLVPLLGTALLIGVAALARLGGRR
jgi:NAD(P)-dependent dehydrogenase (short-subunit alcohol dehydrogenase family)